MRNKDELPDEGMPGAISGRLSSAGASVPGVLRWVAILEYRCVTDAGSSPHPILRGSLRRLHHACMMDH